MVRRSSAPYEGRGEGGGEGNGGRLGGGEGGGEGSGEGYWTTSAAGQDKTAGKKRTYL